ncbi:ArnT family glycosyltransferase [Dyella acidiphila]|uniref:Glycosyltransferase family 39 protein n=1 Tax=Dyella acidiphila TaxID=2775866 RepID=A0ABR9G4W4_9GAMM|nr:glycosyltransferase family 39 protein [Dyella acidiphila]MBE1159083.1 glycosyltransferase family 39 protein [Dyella acidiphila]
MQNERSQAASVRPRPAYPAYRALLWLIALGLLLGFAFQGTRGLWGPDEGRYVDAALQMLDTGDYLTPGYSPDEVNFSKPPTTYWVLAAAIKLGGRNSWAVRAPYALAFLLTMLALYGMGRRLLPEKPWLPALVYALSAFPFVTANIVSTDVFLCLCEALAMLGFVCAAFGEQARPARRHLWLMWLGWGLAFLTKGPPGLLPLLAVIVFIAGRDGWRGLGRYFLPSGLLLFLAVGLSWYAVVMLRYPWLPHYFLQQEVYNRLFTGAQRRHAGWLGWALVYLPTLLLGSLPWWLSLLRGTPGVLRAQNWRSWRQQHAVAWLLALWFALPFVVFCLAQSRLPLYLLPLFLPIALIVALELRDQIDLHTAQHRAWVLMWVIALLSLKASAAYLMHPPNDNRLIAQQFRQQIASDRYAAMIFIQNTAQSYTIEEETLWGLRLYLDKPVYGIAMLAPDAGQSLCHALHKYPSSLVIIDSYLAPRKIERELQACGIRGMTRVDSWRKRVLEQVQS